MGLDLSDVQRWRMQGVAESSGGVEIGDTRGQQQQWSCVGVG